MSKLASLTKARRAHVESCKKNGDNSHKTIADLYSNRTHFVYELLQNADDAKASEAIFDLSAKSLEFKHDGEPFSFRDVEAITSVGASPKENIPNAIGKFGVGFKSVFAVTESPEIYSGEYQFAIVDFIVPEDVPGESVDDEQTLIVLPFNHKSNAPEKSHRQLENELGHLSAESLLFLRHIKSIRWQTETASGEYRVESDTDTDKRIISSVNGEQTVGNYLVFSADAKIAGKDIGLSVAYRLGDDCRSVVALDDAPLFVFFPVEVMRNAFKFLAHAPYKTTPNRETIPFDDDENQAITAQLSALIARGILQVKERGLLDVDFLSLLPIDNPDNMPAPYQAAFDEVKALLEGDALLPTADRKYAVAEDALLARGKKLTKLLNSENCARLFQRSAWLDTKITSDSAPRLHKYLMQHLSIPEKSMEDFCRDLDEDFISAQSDEWLIDFYIAVDESSEALYRKSPYSPGILRKKPIIRLENDSHACPDDEQGEIQVYLPPKNGESRFRTVKRYIVSNKRAREFFNNLGIHEPNAVTEIKECIRPKYVGDTDNITKAEYMQDFRHVYDMWSKGSDRVKDDIKELLGEVKFIGSFSHGVQFSLRQPKEVYAQNEVTEMWFENNLDDSLRFLADCVADDDGFVKFAKKLGILSRPHIEGKSYYQGYQHPRHIKGLNGFNPTFSVEGLDFALRNINIVRSIYIFNELALPYALKLSGMVHRSSRQDFIGGWCNEKLSMQSPAGKLLINEHWLYDKSGDLIEKSLSEVSADGLCEQYNRDHENFDKLVELLGLAPDFFKQYEEKTGKKLVPMTPEQYEEWLAQSRPDKPSSDDWEEDVAPEDVSPALVPDNSASKPTDAPAPKPITGTNGGATDASVAAERSDANRSSASDWRKIGDWGERYVRPHIENQHPDARVEWLNEGGNLGHGCDYEVRENGKIYYYEVKSRVDECTTMFEVTNAQWRLAQELHANGEGDQYRILLVSNAGKASAKFQEFKDPVGLWKEGKIYAHPVSIRLPPEN